MKYIKDIDDIKNKKVLFRTDIDVPIVNKLVAEDFRISKQKPMLDYLLERNASVLMIAHISAIESFYDILPELRRLFNRDIHIFKNINEISEMEQGKLYLLDNIRRWPEEEKNDKEFSLKLTTGLDLYINNNFAVSHRNHASVSAVTEFLPSYAGFILEEEVVQLEKIISAPKEGKIFIMGGAKAKTKIPVIKNFLDRSENILIGGVIANDILKARGDDIGNARVDDGLEELFSGINLDDPRIVMPEDFNIFENRLPDIGPKSILNYQKIIENAKMIIWNGPMGIFEDDRFISGTKGIAEAVAASRAFKVLGGGDTITAVDRLGLIDKFDFISTGGGAMLSFLAGDKLPGLEVLGYYAK